MASKLDSMELYGTRGIFVNKDTIDDLHANGFSYEYASEGLTKKEQRFCMHYVNTFNKHAAAIQAGYPRKGAKRKGLQLYARPDIRRFIAYLHHHVSQDIMLDGKRILEQYMKIAFADVNDFVSVDEDGYVKPKKSGDFDGTIVNCISQNQAGFVKVEIANRDNALKELQKFAFIMPEDIRLEAEKERLKLEKAKFLHKIESKSKQEISEEGVRRLKEKMDERRKRRQKLHQSHKKGPDPDVMENVREFEYANENLRKQMVDRPNNNGKIKVTEETFKPKKDRKKRNKPKKG